jgi:cyclic pyranopterin phosphate synthase
VVKRTAVAIGKILLQKKTIDLLKANSIKKGDVLTVSKIAGIMGAKQTSNLIPLCHNINLEHVGLEFNITDEGVEIKSYASTSYKTGVEMEALTAVSVAALTIYDMCKAVDKEMTITKIRLLEKKKEDLYK